MSSSFDLGHEPWIAVRTDSGVVEMSILGVFREAAHIRAIAGELPTQDMAIMRLLLVILHRSIPDAGDPTARWRALWERPDMPLGDIRAYLDHWSDRFDLLHASRPFLQVAGLTAGKTTGLSKLIAEVPAGTQFFTTRAAASISTLSFAEAARWLVHAQQYDTSGIKTGAHGDDRVKSGKGYPIGTGFAGRCGLIAVEGSSLRETLLLNLVLSLADFDAEEDLPVWERAPLGPGPEAGHPLPIGFCDLVTWPARRILLHHDGDQVTDALISNGDAIHARNLQQVETMTAWRRSLNQEKLVGGTAYMPRQHDPARALWRGLEGVLTQAVPGGTTKNDAPATLPPATITWLTRLRSRIPLDRSLPLRLHAVGMTYGTQDASVSATYDDALLLRLAVLDDPDLAALATRAVETAAAAVQVLVNLAANLARAAGREPDGPRGRARELAYHQLDGAYRSWLAKLGPGSDHAAEEIRWQLACFSTIRGLGDEFLRNAGRSALIGRTVDKRHLDAALADAWFRAALHKTLPLARGSAADAEQSPPAKEAS